MSFSHLEIVTVTTIPKPAGFEAISKDVAILYGTEIMRDNVDDALFEEEYRNTLQKGTTVAAFDVKGDVVGAGTIITNPRGNKELTLLAVNSSSQGRGLGQHILHLLETMCIEDGIDTLEVFATPSAYSFYSERAGYTPIDEELLTKDLSIVSQK
ncbi:MAG: GNAT family N-acetyltransferase [Patescibacteria group bacterium]|nr:GNAT family N-acetyltransferase [Patescibacteria group bacterium]